jgi:hypothetical protein
MHVVKGDLNGYPVTGGIAGPPGVINTETLSSRLGVGRWTNSPARKKVIVKKPKKGEAKA